jgi:hypothetical protein
MRERTITFDQCSPDERQLIESIIQTDALIEAQLTKLESILERRCDATLDLAQLRQLRESCKWVKGLIDKYEKAPAAQAAVSR